LIEAAIDEEENKQMLPDYSKPMAIIGYLSL